MTPLIETAAAGWIAALLFLAVAALPLVLQRLHISSAAKVGVMRWHYTFAFAVVGIALVHAWLPMSARMMRGVEPTGLWLATAALGVLFAQLVLGVVLKSAGGRPVGIRRLHFALMTSALILIAVHIVLNRA